MTFGARDVARWLGRQFAGWAFGKVAAIAFTGATVSFVVAIVTSTTGQTVMGVTSGIGGLILVVIGLGVGMRHSAANASALLDADLCDEIWKRLAHVDQVLGLMVFTFDQPLDNPERRDACAVATRAIGDLDSYINEQRVRLDPETDSLLMKCLAPLLYLKGRQYHVGNVHQAEEALFRFKDRMSELLNHLRKHRRT